MTADLPPAHYDDGTVTIHHGDCLDVLTALPDNSVDAIVTDPPYGLGFMGREWDALPPGLPWAQQCHRVLKPGGHLLAFGGTRTWHRLAVAVEDAGFEVRDSIAWMYGSGFPKSLNVSKAIDKAAGAERTTKSWLERARVGVFAGDDGDTTATRGNLQCPDCLKRKFAPDYCRCPRDDGAQTDEAAAWEGWGTALKPAFEPIVVARKPLAGTVAGNVLAHGTGALNIDACRVSTEGERVHAPRSDPSKRQSSSVRISPQDDVEAFRAAQAESVERTNTLGRWPANVILDDHAAAELDAQSGHQRDGVAVNRNRTEDNDRAEYSAYQFGNARGGDRTYGGEGGASRFFYVAKADAGERVRLNGTAHPTVKPLDLMRWLVRLVTPPGGTVLEPFAGSRDHRRGVHPRGLPLRRHRTRSRLPAPHHPTHQPPPQPRRRRPRSRRRRRPRHPVRPPGRPPVTNDALPPDEALERWSLDELDALHHRAGLGTEWAASERRRELAATVGAAADRADRLNYGCWRADHIRQATRLLNRLT